MPAVSVIYLDNKFLNKLVKNLEVVIAYSVFFLHWLVMSVGYLKDLFVAAMEAKDPVDLFILPGNIF